MTLLVGIVVVLAGITAAVFLDLGREREPAPDVVFETERPTEGPGMVLVHGGGTSLDGANVELRGVARPNGLSGQFDGGDGHRVFPADEHVEVVWHGERTSYIIWEAGVPPSDRVPEPDENCTWIEAETNGGTDPITVDGIVVSCDIVTDGDVDVINDGAIIGTAESTFNNIDLDESTVYGSVSADGDVDLDGSNVTGSIASTGNDVTITDGSNVDGDVQITGGNVDIDGVTVSGDVYVDPGDLTECSAGATVGEEPCSSYTPNDPDDY